MENKICVYAITKNEAKECEAWYDNMKEADHVIVLDTGSTDGTPDILRGLGCEVHEKAYETFRFDEARTDSMELAYATDANIFLPIDLDERLVLHDSKSPRGWADEIRERWDPDVHERGGFKYYVGNNSNPGYRNWLHNRDWGWLYPVHEVMTRLDGSGIWYTHGHALDMGDVVDQLHNQDWSKGTRKQYLDLCRLRFKENPTDQASACYLVRECMYANEPQEAIALESDISKVPLDGNVGSWVGTFMAWAYEATNQNHKAEAWLYRAYDMDPTCRTAPVSLARLLYSEGNPELAHEVLKKVYETAHTWNGHLMFQDAQDVWTWRLDDWMGVVCSAVGKKEEAVLWYERALAAAEVHDPVAVDHVRHNLEYAKGQLGG